MIDSVSGIIGFGTPYIVNFPASCMSMFSIVYRSHIVLRCMFKALVVNAADPSEKFPSGGASNKLVA